MSGLEQLIPVVGAIALIILGGLIAGGRRHAPVPVPVKRKPRR